MQSDHGLHIYFSPKLAAVGTRWIHVHYSSCIAFVFSFIQNNDFQRTTPTVLYLFYYCGFLNSIEICFDYVNRLLQYPQLMSDTGSDRGMRCDEAPLLKVCGWQGCWPNTPESSPVVQWLSYSPLDPRFAGSIPAGVDGFFFRA